VRRWRVDVVDKTTSGFEIYSTTESRFQADNEANNVVRDINGDGNFELLVDVSFISQDCATRDVTFTVIYAWTGAGYTSVSDSFPDFYRQRLQTLKALQLMNEEDDNRSNWEIEAAKIERFLGQSPDAGIDYANKLGKSHDWRDRMLAAPDTWRYSYRKSEGRPASPKPRRSSRRRRGA
jgi:hypothetical protein